MKNLTLQSRQLAYDEIQKTGMPLKLHVEISTPKAKELAQALNANVDVVEIGTLLMDCVIGKAINEKRVGDHVQMCLAKTNELLQQSDIDEATKENIRHCVLEHHGAEKFYSIESEICCNADCYRFLSVKGFLAAANGLRDLAFEDLLKLLNDKVEEKWALVSLDICKKELEPQYVAIKQLLSNL